MCYPRNDQLIVRLIAEGRIVVDAGQGRVYLKDRRTGHLREASYRIEQAGGRPAAGEYAAIKLRVDGRMTTLRRSRVVYVSVKGPTPYEIDHVNDDPADDRFENLNPLTRFENEAKKREAAYYRQFEPESVGGGVSDVPF